MDNRLPRVGGSCVSVSGRYPVAKWHMFIAPLRPSLHIACPGRITQTTATTLYYLGETIVNEELIPFCYQGESTARTQFCPIKFHSSAWLRRRWRSRRSSCPPLGQIFFLGIITEGGELSGSCSLKRSNGRIKINNRLSSK